MIELTSRKFISIIISLQTKILTLLIYPKLFAMSIIYQLLTNYLYSHFVIFNPIIIKLLLWFAFKLVSLNHWKQLAFTGHRTIRVVICFQISIFEPLKTALFKQLILCYKLWFAFKLVSLNHWKQQYPFSIIIRQSCDLLSN